MAKRTNYNEALDELIKATALKNKAAEAYLEKCENLEKAREARSTVISANAAREIADTGKKSIARIYKAIKECAEDGMVTMHWCVYDFSPVLIQKIETELKSVGYKVFEVKDSVEVGKITELTISW